MRLPSFNNVFSSSLSTFRRFPLTIICVYLATLITMWYTDKMFNNQEVLKLTYTTLVGGLFFLSARIATESYKLSQTIKGTIYFFTFSIIILYYFFIPDDLEDASKCLLWISIGLVIIGHLLVSIVPYIFSNRSTISFRSYNYQLLAKFTTAIFYSLVLYATLALALLSVDQLFEISVKGNTYARLFIFLAGIFNTTYFLSQFPIQYDDESYGQPKGLKVLAEYIMIPVTIIYALILYAYIVKVIGATEDPLQEVRYMIIAFLLLGVFTYLINYHIAKEKRSEFSKYFIRLYFTVALPVSILLIYTAWNESQVTGITDELYLHGMIGLWAIIMAIYIFISKNDDIKWIPISLILVSLISFYTPFIGICNVTVKSQYNNAIKYMKERDILVDGTLQKSDGYDESNQNIYRSIEYLNDYKKLNLIHDLDKNNLIEDHLDSGYEILDQLNIQYNRSQYAQESNLIIHNNDFLNIDITEYSEFFRIADYSVKKGRHSHYVKDENRFVIKNEFKEIENIYIITNQLYSLNYETKYIDLEDENSSVRYYIDFMNYDKAKNTIIDTEGILLYRNK